jgi:hypothetical protein
MNIKDLIVESERLDKHSEVKESTDTTTIDLEEVEKTASLLENDRNGSKKGSFK